MVEIDYARYLWGSGGHTGLEIYQAYEILDQWVDSSRYLYWKFSNPTIVEESVCLPRDRANTSFPAGAVEKIFPEPTIDVPDLVKVHTTDDYLLFGSLLDITLKGKGRKLPSHESHLRKKWKYSYDIRRHIVLPFDHAMQRASARAHLYLEFDDWFREEIGVDNYQLYISNHEWYIGLDNEEPYTLYCLTHGQAAV